jgi:hypothetical protein
MKPLQLAMPPTKPLKFSEHYGLKQDEEFDFLDIYAHQDIQLFLDPFGVASLGTKWSNECESEIATFFQYLIDSIRSGNRKTIRRLLNALHEVNEVGLGFSAGTPQGRGIGPKQAEQLLQAFATSEAAKSGDIRDIADCAIMIPGISSDKISDITANILKRRLVKYTQAQCAKYKIPTRRVPVNNCFDPKTLQFKSDYEPLPVINGQPKILIPLRAVRLDPELSKDKYYRNFVLEYLKAEHERAFDSLAHVLKNGKVVVRIGELKEKYPMRTEFLHQFSKEHPEVLEDYKRQLRTSVLRQNNERLKIKRKPLGVKELITVLKDIPPGNGAASQFHKFTLATLTTILGERVNDPKVEENINGGRKRVDIVYNNANNKGFFRELNDLQQIKCPKIIVECKNYGKELGNPELDQINGRLNNQRGRFGIVVCRTVEDRKTLIQRCRDLVNDNGNYIIVLDDADMVELMKLNEKPAEGGIDKYFTARLDELIM